MVASRLSDGQKGEVVARYRAGDSSTVLAKVFGCSANTITRVVKALLDPQEYASLKQRRGARPARAAGPVADSPDPSPVDPSPEESSPAATSLREPDSLEDPDTLEDPDSLEDADSFEAEAPHHHRVLAIDDADDFGDDEESEDGDDDEGDADDDDEAAGPTFVAVPVLALEQPAEPVTCRPLAEATLPESAYLLVDKQVELEARPLREFTELGPLPDEEAERQAFMVFVNPRQAKRHCGRNQRVIKLPDTALLQRTAPFLLAQGISRVVIEGSLFALPGS
jgi:hypothetical protein